MEGHASVVLDEWDALVSLAILNSLLFFCFPRMYTDADICSLIPYDQHKKKDKICSSDQRKQNQSQ